MPKDSESIVYIVRATEPAGTEQLEYQCVGFAMAHAKAEELRMRGYKDVVMSIAEADHNQTVA